MKKLLPLILVVIFMLASPAQAIDKAELKAANQYYAEQSYALAMSAFEPFLDDKADDAVAREVRYKWADSVIKGQDPAREEKAKKALLELTESKTHDRWWAESGITLATYFMVKDPYSKIADIKRYMDDARDFWAGSDELTTARQRFITISFELADFVTKRWGWYVTDIRPIRMDAKTVRQPIPPENGGSLRVLYEEVLKIAQSDEDKARAHYGIGMAMLQNYGGDAKAKDAIVAHFTTITKEFANSSWADDAAYQLGLAAENRGDFVAAAQAYTDLLAHYRPGESSWRDEAKSRLETITNPALQVSVGGTFVTGSEVQFGVSWRNLKRAEATLYKFDMTENLGLIEANAGYGSNTHQRMGYNSYQEMLQHVVEKSATYRSLPVQLRWNLALDDDGKHTPQSANKGLAEWRLEKKDGALDPKQGLLANGAYLLVLTADGVKPTYELVLVTDMALVSKVGNKRALVLAMDANSGKPKAATTIRYVFSWNDVHGTTQWGEGKGQSDENGLLQINFGDEKAAPNTGNTQHQFFATAIAGTSQAFVQNSYYNYNSNNKGAWWLHAFSDRPVYRPNETVSFKGIVRHYDDGKFSNTAAMAIRARIYDARGVQVKEGTYSLNEYGSFDDTLMLDEKATLGDYRMEIYTADLSTHLASTALFRLEEYKLPEFLVKIQAKPSGTDTKTAAPGFRLGDTIAIDVDAQYYFGGPVAKAQVEYLVYQQAFTFQYQPVRAFAWYYDDMIPRQNTYGHGTLVAQKTITAGADGQAHFTIETPKDSANDLEYTIEARVVDQSRREIRTSQTIKVTKNAFFAVLEPVNNLYRPGDKASVTIRTMTPNEAPMAVEGKVTVQRNWWREPMTSQDGRGQPGGYDGHDILSKFVKTNERGEAIFTFEPSEDGYYAVEFTGFDNGHPVTGLTHIFVSSTASKNIGYQYGGMQIITEKDTYSSGETMRAMIVADKPDTWILLSQEAEELYGQQMLHLEGSVKLIEIPVSDQHTPNFFLNALSGDHAQLKTASTQIIVPPSKQFLNVAITSDKPVYEPQDEGIFDVKVTDKAGKPVSAEIALGLADAAIYGMQEEIAPDIRQYFYGDKRQLTLVTQASFNQRPYLNLVRGDQNSLMTAEERERQTHQNQPTDHDTLQKQGSREEEQNKFRQKSGYDNIGSLGGGKANMLASDSSVAAPAAMPSSVTSLMEARGSAKVAEKKPARGDLRDSKDLDGAAANGAEAEPEHVRNDFRSTVIWQPSLKTAADGTAQVKVKFPDSLTTWRLTARANTPATEVGLMTHEVRSNKALMVRLQAPRFFTERDLSVVSALIDNMTDKTMTVTPVIKTEGLTVTGLYQAGQFVKGELKSLKIPANSQQRVDWAVSASRSGTATIRVQVLSDKKGVSDAMEKTYPVIPHGIEKFIAKALVLRSGDGNELISALSLSIPKERIKETTSLQLTVTPSLAASLLDALPYLADYPYGCVEQTMSRFLPAVIVAKTMRDLGIAAADVNTYISDVLEPRHDPQGHPLRRTEATISKLQSMTQDGTKRLYDFQHADGGWDWWKEGSSDRFMSAYVVWGFGMARDAGVPVKDDVVARAVNYLQVQLVQEENAPDMLAWMLHALAAVGSTSKFEDTQRDRLWAMRDKLNPYARALFALSEHRRGNTDRSKILAQNLINGIDEDKENGTAHWGEAGINHHWSEGGVEATAFVIKALAQIAPESPQLAPAVKWLALNRRGASWKNTRDTAIAILGLSDYLKATHELAPDFTYNVMVNGKNVRSGKVTAENVFSFDRTITVPTETLRDGDNDIKVVMTGRGALYLAAHAKYFTLEEGISKAGNEIFVTRQYFKQSTKETLMKGLTQDWAPIKDGDAIKSGDRVRVDITLDAKNNYEYLLAEDFKPAGLEAIALKSGGGNSITLDRDGRETSDQPFLYQEFRDQKAAFFIDHIKQGKHLIRYELRAEVPGEFHAMPNQTHAMYVPEIRANSDEMHLTIEESEPKP
jgi:hypothetical protein